MNDPNYDELAAMDELPEELRRAVAATNRLVPNRVIESRMISAASRIAANEPDEGVLVEAVSSDGVTPHERRRKKASRRRLLGTLAIAMATFVVVLLIPCDFKITLSGKMEKRRDVDEWVVEADINANQFEHIAAFASAGNKGCEVSYVRTSEPMKVLNGRLSRKEINETAMRMHDGETTIFIELNQEDLSEPRRPGEKVKIKVVCGQKPFGYVWFHEWIGFIKGQFVSY